MHLDPSNVWLQEPTSMAGTWSFDVRMAYNYARLRNVWGRTFSLSPLLYPPQKCPLKALTHPALPREDCDNRSRNRCRTSGRSWSGLLARNGMARTMTAAANTVDLVVSPFPPPNVYRSRMSEDSCHRGAFGEKPIALGKPIALSPIERARSGVRTLHD